MRDLLLTIHLIGVAAWLGGNLTQMTVMPMLERGGHQTAEHWHNASGSMARVYYSLAGVVITLSGAALVLDSDAYSFSDPFVGIGFTTVIIGGILGMAFFAPSSRAAVDAHRIGDPGAAFRIRQRFTIGALADTTLVVFTVWAMVAKLGS